MNRRIVIAAIPDGRLGPEHFRLEECAMPAPGPGQLLVATRIISIDAANRAWLQGATYRGALTDGIVMPALAIAEVVESHAEGFAAGDLVFGDVGWQECAVVDAAAMQLRPRIEPLSHLLSLYGTSALTAYTGLVDIGRLRPGETLVVSAAGGSVGVMVGQIARLLSAGRVVGIAGGADKCRWLIDEIGFDDAIDYRASDFAQRLRAAIPGGIDVYFDNVGGEILDRCLFAMNEHGRIVCCGAVASYDTIKPQAGSRAVPGLLITRQLTMQGFVLDQGSEQAYAAMDQLSVWARNDSLRAVEDKVHGLERTPGALIDQLAGQSRGKKMVIVG